MNLRVMGARVWWNKKAILIVVALAIGLLNSMQVMASSGISWQRTALDIHEWAGVASSGDGTKLAAAANNDYIYTSTDSGVTWTQRTSAGYDYWASIASNSDGTKLIAGTSGDYINISTDSGATWTPHAELGYDYWYGVTSSSDGTKMAAAAYNGYIYTSNDSGATWTAQTGSGIHHWLSLASSSDGTKLVAGTYNNYIYTSTDSGVTWTQQTGSGSRYWSAVASSSDGTKLIAGDRDNFLYTSTDSGVTWTQHSSLGYQSWYGLASSSDGTKLIAAANCNYLYYSSDSGATWSQETAPGLLYWTSVASNNDGTKFIAGSNGYGDGYVYTGKIMTTQGQSIINASVSSVLSLTGTGTVPLLIAPTSSGSASTGSDTIVIATNNGTGYSLLLENSDTVTSLSDGTHSIAPASGTFASPDVLGVNTWGYRVDNAGSFGAGPTTQQTNTASLVGTWAAVPIVGSPHTVKSTSSTTTGDSTVFWYGANVNSTIPSGTYVDTVSYTVLAN